MRRRDLALAFRLLAGARGAELLRSVLTALGIAVAAFAVLMTLSVPQTLSAADERVAMRAPIAKVSPEGMRYYASTELLGQREWLRVEVAAVDASSPRPPGVEVWPSPGESLVSPALQLLLVEQGRVASVPNVVGAIGEAGLGDPDELLSYTVQFDAGASEMAVVGYGDPGVVRDTLTPVVVGELFVIVGLPTVFFLWVVLRLSFHARSRRNAAMRLTGLSGARAARMFAAEMGVLAFIGAVLGTIAFLKAEPAIADSGVLGDDGSTATRR